MYIQETSAPPSLPLCPHLCKSFHRLPTEHADIMMDEDAQRQGEKNKRRDRRKEKRSERAWREGFLHAERAKSLPEQPNSANDRPCLPDCLVHTLYLHSVLTHSCRRFNCYFHNCKSHTHVHTQLYNNQMCSIGLFLFTYIYTDTQAYTKSGWSWQADGEILTREERS